MAAAGMAAKATSKQKTGGATRLAGAATLKPAQLVGTVSLDVDRTQLVKGGKIAAFQPLETVWDDTKATTEQSKKMASLSAGVNRMSSVFEEAAKTREEQRRMMDDLHAHTMQKVEETRGDMERIMGELRSNVGDFVANSESQLEEAKEELRTEQQDKVADLKSRIESLEGRALAVQQGLDDERANRLRETEDVLGPIRKKMQKLAAALEKERRVRLAREGELTKQREVAFEELTHSCKVEQQNREVRAKELHEDCNREQSRLHKRQGLIERTSGQQLAELGKSVEGESQHRSEGQDLIVHEVAEFIRRFQANIIEEGEMG